MSFEYGSVDLATPEGAKGFNRYYTALRQALAGYDRAAGVLKRTVPPVVQEVYKLLSRADLRAEEIIGNEFPTSDPAGAEEFMLFFAHNPEAGSPYSRDLLGAIAIRNLSLTEPRYSPRVCRLMAGLALGNPSVIQIPQGKTVSEFIMVACNETPDPGVNLDTVSMLVDGYADGAYPVRPGDVPVPRYG